MYLFRSDDTEALAVWIFEASTPAEWDEHFEHLRQLASWSGKTGKRAATMLIARDFSRPDAKRRAELARLTEAPGYDPYVAFVTPNMALRAVLTMFGWVQKAPRYEMNFFGTSNDALGWLKQRRNSPLAELETMLASVRADYKEKAGADLP